jgi:hypothetical protein
MNQVARAQPPGAIQRHARQAGDLALHELGAAAAEHALKEILALLLRVAAVAQALRQRVDQVDEIVGERQAAGASHV